MAAVGIAGNVYNWLSYGIAGNSVCRTWESCSLAFPCAVNRVIHDSIACYAHFHNAPLLFVTQKPSENAHSMGFSGVRKSISFRSLLIHLFCDVFPEMPDLCRVDERLHFNLPHFWMVKIFYIGLSPKYPGISKVGKTILIIGKTRSSFIPEQTNLH